MLFAFLILLQLLTVVASLVRDLGRTEAGSGGRIAVILAQAALFGCFLVAARSRPSPGVHGALLAAGFVTMAASVIAAHGPGLDHTTVHAILRIGVAPVALPVVYVCTALRRSLPALAVTGLLYLAVWLLVDGSHDLLHAAERWGAGMAFPAAIAVVWPPLYAAAVNRDRMEEMSRIATERLARATERRHAGEESRRVVHDDVIGALRAVELGLGRPAVVASCRAALDAIDAGPRRAFSAVELLAQAGDVPGIVVSVENGWADEPPPRVLTAMSGAVQEALRNAARHAGVDRAHLDLRQDGAISVIEIRDGGPGAKRAIDGFGTSQSIRGRLEDVGGIAEITAGPHGTTVRLSWTPPRTEPADDITLVSDLRRVYLQLIGVAMTSQVLLLLRYPGHALWVSIAVWVGTAATSLMFASRLGRLTPNPGSADLRSAVILLAPATALSATLAGIGVLNQPDGALLTPGWWPLAMNLGTPALFALTLPWRWAVVPLAAVLATTLALATYDPTLRIIDPTGVLLTSVALIIGSAGFGELLRRGARRAVEAVRHHHEQVAELAWHASYEQAHRRYEQLVSRDVAAFLDEVVAGACSGQASTAALLAEECRDGLYLERPMPEPVRRAVRRARARGLEVVIHASEGRVNVPDAAWDLLADVLADVDRGRVTVRPLGGPDQAVEIAVVPALAALRHRAAAASEEVSVEMSSGATLFRVRDQLRTTPDDETP